MSDKTIVAKIIQKKLVAKITALGPPGPPGEGTEWGEITGTLSAQTDLQAALNAKEATIVAGTTSQYWRGDKTWQTLDKNVVGLSNVTNDAQLKVSSNLADLLSVATARTNLGVYSAAETDAAISAAVGSVDFPVDSVNGQTGTVVLDADDIDDSSTVNKFATAGELADIASNTAARHTHANKTILDNTTASFTTADETKLDGIEAGAEVNNISDVNATDLTDGGDTTLHRHDGRYYTETETDALLSSLEPAIAAGLASQYWRGDKTWQTLNAAALTDFNTAADARIAAQKAQANGLATLDGSSKIPTSQLPAIAVTSTFVVNSQAAQLALTVQEGDVAVRTDQNKSYIHNGGTSGTMADWQELLTPTDTVLSVNGQTGAVTLTKSDVGLGNVTNDAQLKVASNLSDVASVATSRTNLGLGTGDSPTFAGETINGLIDQTNALNTGTTNVYKLSSKTVEGFGSGFNKSGGAEFFMMAGDVVGRTVFGAGVNADTVRRIIIQADGQIDWGSGSAARDVTLRRAAAGKLGMVATSSGTEANILQLRNNASADNTGASLRFTNSTTDSSTFGAAEISGVRTAANGDSNMIFRTASASTLTEAFRLLANGNMQFADGKNIQLNTTTGTKIGTATGQKIGFFNATPVVQQNTTGTTAGFTANASANAVFNESTFTGDVGSTAYTMSDIVRALKTLGLLAT